MQMNFFIERHRTNTNSLFMLKKNLTAKGETCFAAASVNIFTALNSITVYVA